MVRRSHHKNAVIRLQTIYFVEEVRANIVVDDGVKILEDEVAGSYLTSFVEDGLERVFGTGERREAAHIEWARTA